MAFDISIDSSTPRPPAEPPTFEAFVEGHSGSLAHALRLACGDDRVGDSATRAALIKTAQRWKRLESHENVLGWALMAGVSHANKTLSKRPPLAVNAATGGYVRGLPLAEAIAALPLQQRTAAVMAFHLGWDDELAAAASGDQLDAVITRRTRAVSFIAHHLRVDSGVAAHQISELFSMQAAEFEPPLVAAAEVRRRAGRRTLRNRAGTTLAAVALIAGGAGLVQLTSRDLTPEPQGPQPIAAPSTSNDWFAPVSDGRGGFTALNTSGSSDFAKTDDGVTWFEASTWNSRAVDLRTEVTDFTRSGGRYISVIEAVDGIRTAVPPRIATSSNLRDWEIFTIDVDVPDEVEGLQTRPRITKVVAAGSKIMAAIEIEQQADYRSLGIARQDVCVDVDFDALRAFYLCDGEIVTVSRSTELVAASTIFVLSEDEGSFQEVSLPVGADAQSLVSFGASFVVSDRLSDGLSISQDGKTWMRLSDVVVDRFTLISGRANGQAMVVQPNEAGWRSILFAGDRRSVMSSIDLELDPAVVWTEPQLASGPAGWALFVTTSRPWERVDSTPGWAVDTGGWVVSRMPDSETVTAQDQLRLSTYRFSDNSDSLQVGADGSITLSFPDEENAGKVLVEVGGDEIERSRSSDVPGQPKAQVFFSEDGRSWRSIWQSNEETWFGSVAVGDDEVLISGTTLMGSPIAVPLQ